ncbi:hypothetical protein V2G26_006706 [Clonostachys chloroleuca]
MYTAPRCLVDYHVSHSAYLISWRFQFPQNRPPAILPPTLPTPPSLGGGAQLSNIIPCPVWVFFRDSNPDRDFRLSHPYRHVRDAIELAD